MLKLSPCLEMLWGPLPFEQRIAKAAKAQFKAYEFWSWWNKDLALLEKTGKDLGLAVAACCVNTSFSGPAKSMLFPEAKDAFVQAVKDCIPVSKQLGCKTFIATTGNTLPDVPREAQHAACVTALKAGAPVAEDAGITIVLEPLNPLVDHKGYYLNTSEEGFAILSEVNSPAVKLLFDIYHQQITEGNVTRNLVDHIGQIGHFHVADNPGRHEPGTGEINYRYLFERIAATPYSGYLGLEFSPSEPERIDAIMKDVQRLAVV